MENEADIVLTINSALGVLRKHREAQGISRRQIAESLGVSIPAVQDYERNEAAGTITLKSLRKYADALDCDVEIGLIRRPGRAARTPAPAKLLHLPAKAKSPAKDRTPKSPTEDELSNDLGLWSAPVID